MNQMDDQKQMVKVRDYLMNSYGNYGIQDKDIGWDGQNVTLRGDVLFKPEYVKDGRSWMDQGSVDSTMHTYLSQRGMKPQGFESTPYTSPYADQIKSMYDQIMNQPKFDPNSIYDTPVYSALESKYQRLGNDAMANTMSEASALTGGRLNSWATSAGAQAKNAYNEKFTDLIPQLQNNARSDFESEMNQKVNILNLLQGLDSEGYDRWSNDRNFSYGKHQDNLNWNYNKNRDTIEDDRYSNEWEYGIGRDKINDLWRQKEWDYNAGQDAINNSQEWARIYGSGDGGKPGAPLKVPEAPVKDPARPVTGSIAEIPAQTREDIEISMQEMMKSLNPRLWFIQNEPIIVAAFGEDVAEQFRKKVGLSTPKNSTSDIGKKEAFKSRQLE
jgi:hypothetical protein